MSFKPYTGSFVITVAVVIVLEAGVWVEVLVLSSVAFGNTGCKDAMDSSIEGDMLDDSGGDDALARTKRPMTTISRVTPRT